MQRDDIVALVIALAVTVGMVWGTVYFVREIWPILPAWLAMILFILLAVAVIGYPIYALAKWSDRHLAQSRRDKIETPDKGGKQ